MEAQQAEEILIKGLAYLIIIEHASLRESNLYCIQHLFWRMILPGLSNIQEINYEARFKFSKSVKNYY